MLAVTENRSVIGRANLKDLIELCQRTIQYRNIIVFVNMSFFSTLCN